MSDALLVAIVSKGVPEELKPVIAVHQIFQKFKEALQKVEDTEKTRNVTGGGNGKSDNKIMKAKMEILIKEQLNLLNAAHVERKVISQQNVLKVVIVTLLHIQTKLVKNQKIKQTKNMILQMSIPMHLKLMIIISD